MTIMAKSNSIGGLPIISSVLKQLVWNTTIAFFYITIVCMFLLSCRCHFTDMYQMSLVAIPQKELFNISINMIKHERISQEEHWI